MDPRVYAALAEEEDHHWWFVGRRLILRDLLRAHLVPRAERRILDVGSGTGGMFPLLSELGHVEGADSSAAAIEYTHQRFPQFVVHQAALPDGLPAREWDLITAFDVIEHLDKPIESLCAMREHLSPKGEIAISVPAYELLWSEHDVVHHHKRRYTRESLDDHVTRAGLRVRYMTHFNTWLLPVIAGVRLAGKLRPSRRPRETSLAAPTRFNRTLTWIFASERIVLNRMTLPVGVSIFALAERS
jgi:2-polyprenyl-3-methyl-5-hydroxy-6-metoxy-1,4-benzoquinol methylase